MNDIDRELKLREIRALEANARAAARNKPIGCGTIAIGVFVGLVLFAMIPILLIPTCVGVVGAAGAAGAAGISEAMRKQAEEERQRRARMTPEQLKAEQQAADAEAAKRMKDASFPPGPEADPKPSQPAPETSSTPASPKR